jgi:hypothetical protein
VILATAALEIQATILLFNLIMLDDSESAAIAGFFRKEVMNRAMRPLGTDAQSSNRG